MGIMVTVDREITKIVAQSLPYDIVTKENKYGFKNKINKKRHGSVFARP
jgi:hypothetical protein